MGPVTLTRAPGGSMREDAWQLLAQGTADPCHSVLPPGTCCFHCSAMILASPVFIPRHLLCGKNQQKAAKTAVQRELQSLAQLMFIKNGIYSWAFSRVAYFNNTKQITQKYQHTHTHPLKKVFTINFMRSWLNCWKNVEMKSHFWNTLSCFETFWYIVSIILSNLEALGCPRLCDWRRKWSSLMSRNTTGYVHCEHVLISNESSPLNIKKCPLPLTPTGLCSVN